MGGGEQEIGHLHLGRLLVACNKVKALPYVAAPWIMQESGRARGGDGGEEEQGSRGGGGGMGGVGRGGDGEETYTEENLA